jgi:hypothetical protein
MPSAEALRKAWVERTRSCPVEPVMTLTEAGLVLGAGTLLMKRRPGSGGGPALRIDGAEQRILALLAVAYERPVPAGVIGNIRRAARDWDGGETCLALIHLARTGLSALTNGELAPFRLFLAERLLDDGFDPRQLLEYCDIDATALDVVKAGFNPGEPRLPAGGGRASGEWTTDGGTGVAAAQRKPAPGEYQTGDPDAFFDTLYDPVHALAHRLGIDENWLFGLALIESGWLDEHNRELNDPFGVTHAGGPNVQFDSMDDAVASWERHYGPVVQGATSAQDFVERLFAAKYNTNPGWPGLILNGIRSVPSHLSAWKAKRGI